jgi:D-alanyl-D-alanine carboxypeptidase
MKIRITLLGLLAAASVAASADAPSPARRQMDGFIAAFNTGDRAKIEAFGREHMPPDFMRTAIIDQTVQMYERTGGYDVVDVVESNPTALKAHVRERRTQDVVVMTVAVDDAAPERITTIAFQDSGTAVQTPR